MAQNSFFKAGDSVLSREEERFVLLKEQEAGKCGNQPCELVSESHGSDVQCLLAEERILVSLLLHGGH